MLSSLVYSERCRQSSPYVHTKAGIGATSRAKSARTVNPYPHPTAATRGAVANGRKVPIRHLVISTAVRADAEYSPKASTTYAVTGTMLSMRRKPRSTTDARRSDTGSLYSAVQPYRAIVKGSDREPKITSGSRFSGCEILSSGRFNLMYMASNAVLQTMMPRKAPTPARPLADALSLTRSTDYLLNARKAAPIKDGGSP